MAKHGVLFEKDNFIPSLTMNRGAISTTDLDGGAIVVVGASSTTEKELYTVSAPASSTVKQVAIVYNPSVKYDVIGGQLYPAKSLDDRNYYNIAGRALDVFYPIENIEFGITMANIEGTTAPVVGKFLEPTVGKNTYSIKNSQTANVPSFEVVAIENAIYPTGDFSSDTEPVYVLKTRFNG